MALTYFSMQGDRAEESPANLHDEDVGVDELMFDPTVADLWKVDPLADAVP